MVWSKGKLPYSAEEIDSYIKDIAELEDLKLSQRNGDRVAQIQVNIDIMQQILEHMLRRNKKVLQ